MQTITEAAIEKIARAIHRASFEFHHKAGQVSPIQRKPDKSVLEFEGETFELKP